MSDKESRPDTNAFLFAAHLYVLVVGTLIFAIGSDISHAVEAYGRTYGS